MLQLELACQVEHPHLNLPSLPFSHHVPLLQKTIDNYLMVNRHSRYDSNVHNALCHLLENRDLFRRHVLSISGYELDSEILLDEENKPLAVPESCYYLHADKVVDLLAAKFQLNHMKRGYGVSDWISLASDWEVEAQDVRQRIRTKIAIEADGPYHYAVNCPHPLGRTVLKHRQLQALGWDVISVSVCGIHTYFC